MKRQWILRLNIAHAAFIAPLRLHPEVEACTDNDTLWLRGPQDDAAIEQTLWLVPGDRFHLAANGQLIPWNHLLPVAPGPSGPWMPLTTFMPLAPTPAALPGVIAHHVPLRLIRGGSERPIAILATTVDAWSQFVAAVPAIRLARLQFALSESGRALIRGEPLPSLQAEPYALESGIAVPAGYTWSPAVRPEFLAERIGLEKSEIALFSTDATFELVPASAWVKASRSAVRISTEGVAS